MKTLRDLVELLKQNNHCINIGKLEISGAEEMSDEDPLSDNILSDIDIKYNNDLLFWIPFVVKKLDEELSSLNISRIDGKFITKDITDKETNLKQKIDEQQEEIESLKEKIGNNVDMQIMFEQCKGSLEVYEKIFKDNKTITLNK